MNWKEPLLETITSTNVIFFDEKYKDTCKRICKILNIDLFPDLDTDSIKTLKEGEWYKGSIDDNQKLPKDTKVFDKIVIEKMGLSNSNILLVYDNKFLYGILHFTDFNNQIVYQSLYQNFYEFETNIREYLTFLGIEYLDFENYYEYKINEKKSDYYKKKLEQLRSPGFKQKSGKLANLQKLELRETLNFAISSYHNKSGIWGLPINGINKKVDRVCNLRNKIMHSVDFTGQTPDVPHDFNTFSIFFEEVQDFKEAFQIIKELRQKQQEDNAIRFNKNRLEQLEKMGEDEIKRFFYTMQ